jgi:hypothetical protein
MPKNFDLRRAGAVRLEKISGVSFSSSENSQNIKATPERLRKYATFRLQTSDRREFQAELRVRLPARLLVLFFLIRLK